MGINRLFDMDLFDTYKSIDEEVNQIKGRPDKIETKKIMMSNLAEKYKAKLVKYNEIAKEFATDFIHKFKLNDHVISARIGSPTPYGNQPKTYLWSGIAIDKDKSFSFQYSWVFQPNILEITFCFGSGGSASGNIKKEKIVERENNLRKLEDRLSKVLSEPANRSIIEQLVNNEGFVLTSEWLTVDGSGNKDIDNYIANLNSNNGAKSGITRFFYRDELLNNDFNLEEKIFHYFEIFKPVWEQLKKNDIKEYNSNFSVEGLKIKEEKSEKVEETKLKKLSPYTYKDIIDHISYYIACKGFYYDEVEITNLFLSLKTKPFVIISGISGTGKTKIVQWFAESIGATEKNGQFSLIPIRPDWNDGSDLLGYVDIKGEFKEGPLTKVIKNAHMNPEFPYFVLLDEMNLARVEYYFSDILSVMESRKWENDAVVTSTLLSSDVYGEDLTLPNNLYIIGTVNMDETTHPFSKKVLDRANTIEFNSVNLGNLLFLTELEEVEPKVIGQDRFATKYLHLKDVYKENKEIVTSATDELVRINELLKLINAHVGYRVRDEICFYLAYNDQYKLMEFNNAFDHCILQKILPRIAGSDTRVEQLLRGLYSLFANQDYEEDNQIDIQNAKYPRSAAKVAEMLGRLRDDRFTSFWIS